jgi:hypothetical protein
MSLLSVLEVEGVDITNRPNRNGNVEMGPLIIGATVTTVPSTPTRVADGSDDTDG